MKKLFVCFILFIIMVLTACSNSKYEETIDTMPEMETETETETNYEENIDLYDFNSVDFTLLVKGSGAGTYGLNYDNVDFYVENETGDIVNDAIYQRYTAVEEKLNINLIVTYEGESNNDIMLHKSILANDNTYDAAVINLRADGVDAMELAQNNLLLNLYDLNEIYLSMSC